MMPTTLPVSRNAADPVGSLSVGGTSGTSEHPSVTGDFSSLSNYLKYFLLSDFRHCSPLRLTIGRLVVLSSSGSNLL
jgi:hypothetical protein